MKIIAANNRANYNYTISNKIEADSMSLINSFTNKDFLKNLNLTSDSVLSLFLPNTYEFFWNTSADDFRE